MKTVNPNSPILSAVTLKNRETGFTYNIAKRNPRTKAEIPISKGLRFLKLSNTL